MQGIFYCSRLNGRKEFKMIKTIRIKEVIAKRPDIEEELTQLMELTEQITIQSVIACDLAQTIMMKLEGDE